MEWAGHTYAMRLLGPIVALLLVLNPVCSGWCQSLVCNAARPSAGEPPCHQSTGAQNSPAGALPSAQSCALRELPAALPNSLRTVDSVKAIAANSQLRPAEALPSIRAANRYSGAGCFLQALADVGLQKLRLDSSSTVLRI